MNRNLPIALLSFLALVGCDSKQAAQGSAAPSSATSSAPAAKATPACADPKARMFDKGGFCITLPEGFGEPKEEADGAWVNFRFEAPDGWNSVTVKRKNPPRLQEFEQTRSLVLGEDSRKEKQVIEDGPTPDGKGFLLVTEREPNRWITVLTRSSRSVYQCSTWAHSGTPKAGQVEICKSLVALD